MKTIVQFSLGESPSYDHGKQKIQKITAVLSFILVQVPQSWMDITICNSYISSPRQSAIKVMSNFFSQKEISYNI